MIDLGGICCGDGVRSGRKLLKASLGALMNLSPLMTVEEYDFLTNKGIAVARTER